MLSCEPVLLPSPPDWNGGVLGGPAPSVVHHGSRHRASGRPAQTVGGASRSEPETGGEPETVRLGAACGTWVVQYVTLHEVSTFHECD